MTTVLAYPGVRAALAAAGRARRPDPADRVRAEAAWEEYRAATRAVEPTPSVSTHAGELAGVHGLRGADMVHLASLLAVGAADTGLAGWDRRLRAGARSVGVRTAPTG